MAHGQVTTNVPAELKSAAVGGVVASAEGIFDYNENKTQEQLNQDLKKAIEDIDVTDQIGSKLDKTEAANLYQPKGNYLTEHQDISGKANITDVYTKQQVDTALGNKQDTLADSEDVVKVTKENSVALNFANKTYNSAAFSGLGKTYLRKNIVTLEGVEKNVLTQAMVNTANTIYHIQYDYDLNGQTITLPAGCVLEFDGGSIANGFLNLNNAELRGDVNITAEPAWDETNEFWEEYKPSNLVLNVSWFGAKADGVSDDAPAIKRCIKWLHKNGATMVFDLKGTYILGDGVKDLANDPNMTLHTGYSYDPTSAVMTGEWTGISDRGAYIAAHPANIGRDISLTFFRFTNLTIEGNGVIIKSHDGNGYCKHNELFRFCGCDYLKVQDITIDANRDNRPDTWDCLGDYGFGEEIVSYDMLMSDSLYDVLQRTNTWAGGVGTREISSGYRQVQNLVLIYCNNARVENVISRGSLIDGLNYNGYSSHLPHELNVCNSIFEHSSRHNFTTGGASACVLDGCTFQFAGLKEDETTELWGSTCSNIDLEGEVGVIENVAVRNSIFRKTAKNTFVITLNARYCLVDGCRFEGAGVNPRPNKGAFKNEIKNCTFINASCPFYQEGINVHHNQFIFKDYTGSIIDYIPFNYDNSFIYGNVSGNKASIVPSRFCNNYIECSWTESVTPGAPIIRVEGNYEINDNVFVNVQGHSTLGAIMAFCKSFVGNKFIRDTDTYPWLVGGVNSNAWAALKEEINIEAIEDGVNTNVYGYKSQLKANGCVEYHITRNTSNKPFWMQLSGIKAEIEIFSSVGSSVKAHYYKTSKGGWDGVFGTYENTNSAITFTGYYHQTTAPYIKIESLTLINIHIVIYQQNKKTIDNAIILSTAPSTSGYQTFKDVNPVLNTLPSYNKWIKSHAILSKNLHKMCIKAQGDGFYTHDGWPATYATRGTTTQRPTLTADMDGFEYYDTTLHLFIHWDGTQWVNATGTAV